jgi:hypothetical protein
MSWSGGVLEKLSSEPCELRARLSPGDISGEVALHKWSRQVGGERQFSSGHPAMQALNPAVYELFI